MQQEIMGEPKPVISSSADESKIQAASSNAGTLSLFFKYFILNY